MTSMPRNGLLNTSFVFGSTITANTLPMQESISNQTSGNIHDQGDPYLIKLLSITNTLTCWIALISTIVGIIGNILVILVQSKAKKLSAYKLLITHLAFSDLLYNFIQVFWTHRRFNKHKWIFGDFMCKITFLWPSAISCSMFTIALIAMERHRSITYPFSPKWRLRKVLLSLIGCWALAISLQIPVGVKKSTRRIWNGLDCAVKFGKNEGLLKEFLEIAMFVTTYPIPLVIIVFCYIHIGWQAIHGFRFPGGSMEDGVRNRSKDTKTNVSENRRKSRKCKKLLVMLGLVVATFVLTTTPNHVMILWFQYCDKTNKHIDDLRRDFLILHLLSSLVHLHGCMNPIIYCISDQKFRIKLKLLLLSLRKRVVYTCYVRHDRHQKSLQISRPTATITGNS